MSRYRGQHDKAPQYTVASDYRLYLFSLLVALPSIGLLVYFWVVSGQGLFSKVMITGLVLLWVLVMANLVRQHFLYHLRTLSTLVEAIRLEDYNFRSSRSREPGGLGELYLQVNALASQLQYSHQQEEELRSLLTKIISQINVAILAFDSEQKIRLVNPQAARLLDLPAQSLIDQSFADTAFSQLAYSTEPSLLDFRFPGAEGRWQIVWQEYRYRGRPGKLLFITDLKQVLSEEESRAWRSLIRVIAHEVNNSLTPISSISQMLLTKLQRGEVPARDEDFAQGLELVASRADDLTGFIAEYARIARLPTPVMSEFSLAALLLKTAKLFADRPLLLTEPVPEITLLADPVLIEQLLINLLKNAFEASSGDSETVTLHCSYTAERCQIVVSDQGQGIANPANLFVPFYTTKPKGSGIGLVLCRQIAEAHRGYLTLENRADQRGAIATVALPLAKAL
ncbi:MAG: ATP-binding protein [Halioglobus sp.]